MTETQHIEYKQSWQDDYLRWICGFANADGGVLQIGCDDSGQFVGIQDAKKLMEDLPNKVRDVLGILVEVNLHKSQDNDYLEIVVEPCTTPVGYKGRYYRRSGSTLQELKGASLDRFILRKQGKNWDSVPLTGLAVEHLSVTAMERFKLQSSKCGRMPDTMLQETTPEFLHSLNLSEHNHLNRATALLFTDVPERWVPGLWIKIGFFLTNDNLRYQDEVHGCLMEQVSKTLDLLLTKYLKAYIHYEGIQRKERFLFPVEALREALLNAIIHKDYSSGIPIQISVYEDRLVIWNSGVLPDRWTIEDLYKKHPSNPFNPVLANVFFRAGYIESWGRGIEKICKECERHQIKDLQFETRLSGMMVTFVANSEHLSQGLPEHANAEMSVEMSGKMSGKTISILQERPQSTVSEIAHQLNRTERTVYRILNELKRQGRIERIGSDKSGYWKVTLPAKTGQ